MTTMPANSASAAQPYGYLLAHFIENSRGYAEKLYLDISHGDDPTQWDPLNAGRPILASASHTTGVRDPCICKNPQTGEYYIVATDLRVFGGNDGSTVPTNPKGETGWAYWSHHGSTRLVVWRSHDLINWGKPDYIDASIRADGSHANLGMAWAPVAVWQPNLFGDGQGGFIVLFSADLMDSGARKHERKPYSRLMWATTTDFTADTFRLGGIFADDGGETIDVTILRRRLPSPFTSASKQMIRTYRIYKDNSFGRGIRMQSTDDSRWWKDAHWTDVQEQIGARYSGGNPGGVEGPAVFPVHNSHQWMLFVDVIPSIGYRPLVTSNPDRGWQYPTREWLKRFHLTAHTKHGVVLSLTRAEYDRLRNADALAFASRVRSGIPEFGQPFDVGTTRPATISCILSDGRTRDLPIVWEKTMRDERNGEKLMYGHVQAISANYSGWTSQGGTNAWNAPDKRLERATALKVVSHLDEEQ